MFPIQACVVRWSDALEQNCPVLLLHYVHNYKECNKAESFLHVLIPRSEDKLGNEQCRMFIRATTNGRE